MDIDIDRYMHMELDVYIRRRRPSLMVLLTMPRSSKLAHVRDSSNQYRYR